MANLKFFKGAFTAANTYVDGGVYFDNTTHEIRIGKGGTGLYDAFGSGIKSVEVVNNKLTIKYFNAGTADVVLDCSSFMTEAEVAAAIAAAIGQVPAYSLVKDSASGDYAAVYHLTKDGVNEGAAINIPKDMVIKAAGVVNYDGSAVKITIGGVEYDVEGTHAAGKYVVMIVNNAESGASQIWLNVQDLVDVYTGGSTDTIEVSISDANVITADLKANSVQWGNLHADLQAKINGKVDRLIETSVGKAYIFNESDGGGAKFERADGEWSFVGVNSEGAIGAQIYDIDCNGTAETNPNYKKGTRINVTKDAIYYTNGNQNASYVAGDEIATKKDLPGIASSSSLGTIKIGEGLDIAADGTLSVDATILSDIQVTGGVGISVSHSGNTFTVNSTVATVAEIGAVRSASSTNGNIEVDADGYMNTIWSSYSN